MDIDTLINPDDDKWSKERRAGKAGGYQVKGGNVYNALMLNIGGGATTNYVFIVGRE